MHGLRIPSSTALLLCGGLQFAGAAAMAADCDGSSDPCSVDLGRVTASFAAGAASYGAEVLLVNGSDASFSPPQSLPALQVIHTAASDGFRIQPQLYAYVGGSGVQGLHEVVAMLQFAGLSFTADPGYQVNGVQAVITGSFSLVGNGYGGLGMPGAVQWNDSNFSTTVALDPAASDLSIGFSLAASYVEGDDGTAASYGAGSASIDSLEFIVSVSPVPEPAPAALLAAGAVVLHWLARRRRARR